MSNLLENTHDVAALVSIGLLGMLKPFLPEPATRAMEQDANRMAPNKLPPEQNLIKARRLGEIGEDEYYEKMKKHGFSERHADEVYSTTQQLLKGTDLAILRRRNEISKEVFDNRMEMIGIQEELREPLYKLTEERLGVKEVIDALWRNIPLGEPEGKRKEAIEKTGSGEDDLSRKQKQELKQQLLDQGWDEKQVETALNVNKFYPSPGQLIEWEAKEVFEEKLVQDFGLRDEFEALRMDLFEKTGVSEKQAENFWIAHWEHPSWRRVREMFARTDLSKKTVKRWMKLVEIPPVWRDKLVKVMFRPYTRVDVRRMYDRGVLDEKGVFLNYTELRYNWNAGEHWHEDPEEAFNCDKCRNESKAGQMTDYTMNFYEDKEEQKLTVKEKRQQELKGITRANIQDQFEDHQIDESRAKRLMTGIGYGETAADFYIAQSKYDMRQEKMKGRIRAIHNKFMNGVINLNDVSDQLDELNLPGDRKEYYMEIWQDELEARPAQPSKTDLRDWRILGIINWDQWETRMSKMGYVDDDVEKYKQEIKAKYSDKLQKA